MAASRLPKPGTEFGPCATAPLSAFPGHVECGRALDAAERERDQARADLRTYGEHRRDCLADTGRGYPCGCGLAEALARAEGRDV